jgi:hypothetical protein
MAKNRKYRSAALRFGPALKAFLLCLFIGGSGIGYVWQKNQLYELGKQIKQRETRLTALNQQNEKLKQQLAWLHSPIFLKGRIKDLGLAEPSISQIWHLPEPARDSQQPIPMQPDARFASAP